YLVVHTIADSDGHPVGDSHAACPAIARSLPRLVILEPGIDVIRVLHIHGEGVDLTQGQVRQVVTRLAPIVRDKDSPIRSRHHPVGVLWIDPEGPEVAERSSENSVALRPAESGPGFAAIFRAGYGSSGDEDPLGVIWINSDLVEGIARLSAHIVFRRVHLSPCRTAIVGPIDFAAEQLARRRTGAARLLICRNAVPVINHRVYRPGILPVNVD